MDHRVAPFRQAGPVAPPYSQRPGGKPRVYGWLIAAVVVVFLGALALAAGVGGFLLYTDYQYNKALDSEKKQNFGDAQLHLSRVVSFYKDAQKLMAYAQAGEALQDGDYNNAKYLYGSLGDFLETKTATDLNGIVYEAALEKYRGGEYRAAAGYFDMLGEYGQSGDYLVLAEAYEMVAEDKDDYRAQKALFAKLERLGTLSDAQALMATDLFIYYRLEGKWTDAGGDYVDLVRNQKSNSWTLDDNISQNTGKYFKIEQCVCQFGSNEEGWAQGYLLGFPKPGQLSVYCYKDGKTYLLTRN